MSRIQIPRTLQDWNEAGGEYLPGLLGIEFTLVDDDEVRGRMAVRKSLLAWNGYLHAGSVVSFADSACGYGTVNSLPADAIGFTTLELKSNFLGTARDGYVECIARPVHKGRTTQVWDAEVNLEGGHKTIARFRCTQLILRS
jgi:uncharacterized protein (TIGR00369 family)